MNAARRLAFWLLLCLCLLAQAPAFAELRTPFYKAERNGQTVYVLGTLHVGRADFYPLRPAIETAVKKSARLYLEIDQDESGAEQKMAQAMLCQRACLKEALSESEWRTLSQRLGNQDAALRELERMRPWAAAIVLTLGDFAALGLNSEHGAEKQVSMLAGNGKKTTGLENADEQIRLFTGMTPSEQKEMLTQWLGMTARERLNLNLQLVELWKQGDADAMYGWYKQVEARYSGSPTIAESFDRKFLVARNQAFVERLLAQIGSTPGPFFLAVGALHLGGPDGVLALLKQRGFQVKAE
jgi:Uncharacterized protein conserved in bacteria